MGFELSLNQRKFYNSNCYVIKSLLLDLYKDIYIYVFVYLSIYLSIYLIWLYVKHIMLRVELGLTLENNDQRMLDIINTNGIIDR